jgi:hypothetical protein
MSDATSIPILVGGDTGWGNFNNMRRAVAKLGQRSVAGICIEDKLFPKTNSFIGNGQPLADIDEFFGKIKARKNGRNEYSEEERVTERPATLESLHARVMSRVSMGSLPTANGGIRIRRPGKADIFCVHRSRPFTARPRTPRNGCSTRKPNSGSIELTRGWETTCGTTNSTGGA